MHAHGHTDSQPGCEGLNGHRHVIMYGLQHLWIYSSALHRPESIVMEAELKRGRRWGPQGPLKETILVDLADAKREHRKLPSDPSWSQSPSPSPCVFSPLPQLAGFGIGSHFNQKISRVNGMKTQDSALNCLPRRQEDALFQHDCLPGSQGHGK